MGKKVEPKSNVPSSEMVDAYKSYLHKASPTVTAKDFTEGAPIPTEQVEKDILILENKIVQFKKFGFPCEKEEKQVEILKKYKAGVAGKNWPTAKQAMNSAGMGCQHNITTSHTMPNGAEMVKCAQCSRVWHAPPQAGIWHKPSILKDIKPIPIKYGALDTKDSKPLVLRVGKVAVEQRFIQQLGMLSNCNVNIHSISGGYMNAFILHCSKCDKRLELTDELLVAKERTLPAKCVEFCTEHAHNDKAMEKEGRHFREE